MDKKARKVFEVSWEVCNKVGGIYTVLASKAKLMKDIYKNNYFVIGPYVKNNALDELDFLEPPNEFRDIFEELKSLGVYCHFGKWRVEGKPNCILLEFDHLFNRVDEFKFSFWEHNQIDSLGSSHDFNEPLVFSVAVSYLIESLEKKSFVNEKDILHCHEWMTGFSFLRLKNIGSKIKSVFTTHATVLGRSLAGNNHDLYGNLDKVNVEGEARRLNVFDKFSSERAMANSCDVFTTVSEITSYESEKLLGRKPEVLVLNGVNLSILPNLAKINKIRKVVRPKIIDVINSMSFPSVVKDPLIYYFGGRYEFRAKGLDVYLDSLIKLNETLVKENGREVVAIFLLATYNDGLKNEVLIKHNDYLNVLNRERDFKGIYGSLNDAGLNASKNKLNSYDYRILCSHKFGDEENDALIKGIRSRGLDKTEKVKVLVFPTYLDGKDGLLNLTYYEVVCGCDLGVFPSYYEPWGYTPLESLSLSIPSITSMYAGFGRYVKDKSGKGIRVINEGSRDEFIDELYDFLYDFSKLSFKSFSSERKASLEVAKMAQWDDLILNYVKAHNLSIDK
ncbi:MAG: glycogen/starch synthase [Candidatus Woesearchaeota archaeon]